MNSLSKLIKKKKQNPYYKKLSEVLTKQGINIDIKRAYFMFGIPYTDTSLDEIKVAIADNRLNELKKRMPYNVNVDNVELYLLEDVNDNVSVVLLLDPYELYSAENILEIIPIVYTNFEKEIIFP
ncbi:MAG: hypothetical protein J0H55_16670 [Chitinophagaceae bacterium]|nr:hypothetical protein [Chitinophagaceae bacterium]